MIMNNNNNYQSNNHKKKNMIMKNSKIYKVILFLRNNCSNKIKRTKVLKISKVKFWIIKS